MGIGRRNDEIRNRVAQMQRDHDAQAEALATVEQFNARFEAKKTAWCWPTIAAALVSKHYWLVIACDSCGTVIDLDLTMKRRDPDASIQIALADVRCPRCNGHGRTRIAKLARFPSI
jgi:hypothetical protein